MSASFRVDKTHRMFDILKRIHFFLLLFRAECQWNLRFHEHATHFNGIAHYKIESMKIQMKNSRVCKREKKNETRRSYRKIESHRNPLSGFCSVHLSHSLVESRCEKESAVTNTITSDLRWVWTKGRYRVYAISILLHFIIISFEFCQVNYHDFRLDVFHAITLSCQMKRKLDMKLNRIRKMTNATSQCSNCVVRALTHHHCSLYF